MATKHKAPPPPGLTAAEFERLTSFMPEIAAKARGSLHPENNGSFRAGTDRGIVIYPGGTFYDFAAGSGGRGPIEFIQHLVGHDLAKAIAYAKKYLVDHPGTGSLASGADADEDTPRDEDDLRRTTEINEIWQAPAYRRLPGGGLPEIAPPRPRPSGQEAIAPVDECFDRFRLHAGGDHCD